MVQVPGGWYTLEIPGAGENDNGTGDLDLFGLLGPPACWSEPSCDGYLAHPPRPSHSDRGTGRREVLLPQHLGPEPPQSFLPGRSPTRRWRCASRAVGPACTCRQRYLASGLALRRDLGRRTFRGTGGGRILPTPVEPLLGHDSSILDMERPPCRLVSSTLTYIESAPCPIPTPTEMYTPSYDITFAFSSSL